MADADLAIISLTREDAEALWRLAVETEDRTDAEHGALVRLHLALVRPQDQA